MERAFFGSELAALLSRHIAYYSEPIAGMTENERDSCRLALLDFAEAIGISSEELKNSGPERATGYKA
jgi:hypothetical protein